MVKAIHVGLGNWGFSWARDVVPTVEAVETVAYVDANAEALKRVQTELDVDPALCFASLKDAAQAVEADLVIATLRTDVHYPVVSEALGLGYHVIVEKPFTSTMQEAHKLVAKAKAHDRILMVSQNYRYNPAPVLVADMVASGALGEVNMVSIDFRKHAPSIGYRYWEMPDPLLADMAIHHFDLMRMVLGDNPKRVSCRTWNTRDSRFVHHPIGVATLEFEKGTVISYRGSWMSGADDTPWAGHWSMDCSQGEIWWTSRDHRSGQVLPDRVRVKRIDGKDEKPDLPQFKLLDRAGALNAMSIAVESGEIPAHFSAGHDNLMSMALVRATIASASDSGRWVEIGEVLDTPA